MSQIFERFLDDAVGEVARRECNYFSNFEVSSLDLGRQIQTYSSHTLFASYSQSRISECLRAAKLALTARGVVFAETKAVADPISELLYDSAMDAFAVAEGRLPIDPEPVDDGAFPEHFASLFDQRKTSAGIRYFIGRRGHKPLLLVTAVGVPITLWSKLLSDRRHEFRIIVVETRHSDLFGGGLRGDTDPRTDAQDIAAVLESEGERRCDVLAWSNGARVAIELARRRPALVRSLVLVAPTFSGIEDLPSMPSPFEEQLTKIFAAVGNNPVAANFFSKALNDSLCLRNWEKGNITAERRARALLSLPAKEHVPMLIAPLAKSELLFHFIHRFAADLAYPMRDRLSSLKLPVLVITGDHDTIVSNPHTQAVLTRFVPHFLRADIKGAGHCIQDLQYRYLRWLLRLFLEDERPVISTARVSVVRSPAATDFANLGSI